jgi:hypothetical protein
LRWKKILPKDKNIGKGDIDVYTPVNQEWFVYGEQGKQYPRLVITVHINSKFEQTLQCNTPCFNLTAYYKKKNSEAWWTESHIPLELMDDLRELLDRI